MDGPLVRRHEGIVQIAAADPHEGGYESDGESDCAFDGLGRQVRSQVPACPVEQHFEGDQHGHNGKDDFKRFP